MYTRDWYDVYIGLKRRTFFIENKNVRLNVEFRFAENLITFSSGFVKNN